jgi:hypothetical protein
VKRGRHENENSGALGALIIALLVIGFLALFTYVLVYAR